jgi:hypothetical protein
MHRDSSGISLLEILFSSAIVAIGVMVSSQLITNSRRGLMRPLRLWQAQIAGQSVADAVASLEKTPYLTLLQSASGPTPFNSSNQPWLLQWQRSGVQSVSFVVNLKKNGSTCTYPRPSACSPNPITENLAGWSSEVIVEVSWKGDAANPAQTLSWTKFVPATP